MKRILGFLFWLIWNILINILSYTAAIFLLIFSFFLTEKQGAILRKIVSIWAKVGMALALSPVEVRGKENLSKDPVMVICNHQSTMDILTCVGYFPLDFLFFSKKEVFYFPVIGTLMKKMNYISVDRSNPKRAAMSLMRAIDKIKMNNRVLIYPEGSRNPDPRNLLSFKPGTLLLARRGKVPITPIIIHGTSTLWPINKMFYMWPTKIVMNILPAIYPGDPLHPSTAKSVAEEDEILEKLRATLSKSYNVLADELENIT